MEPFVSADWLEAHREDVALIDIRFNLDGSPGRAAYEQGHIPGAVYVELAEVLSDPEAPESEGRHPLPSPEGFAHGLALAGVSDRTPIIAYDDSGCVTAARLVWLARAIGHPAALLDGGIGAYQAANPGQPLETGSGPTPEPAEFTPVAWPTERFADIDETAAAAQDGSAIVIDARDSKRFAGGPDPVDPRSGHIPGAKSVPTRDHLDPATKQIVNIDDLLDTFAAVGIEPGTPVISYCGSGVTACHNLLALELAGLGPARLYPGSWSQWSRDEDRPIATGSD